jgi:hypothetical protein
MVAIFIEDRLDVWAKAPVGTVNEARASPPARRSMNVRRVAGKGKAFVITHSIARSKQKRAKARRMGLGEQLGTGRHLCQGTSDET